MANMQRRSPGEVARFSGSALISTDLPSYAVDTGQASRVLADAAGSLSGALSKLADRAAQREGAAEGLSAGQASGAAYLQARAVATQARSAGNSSYRDAIASIESRGSGDYAAVGPQNSKMGRALGRYQIMEANIGPWSKAALGRAVSAQEFMDPEKGPAIQDAVFDHVFGGYVQKYGAEGAAQAWFAGPGGVGKTNRKDVLGTDVGSYGKKFLSALGQAPSAASEAKANTYQAPVLDTKPLALRRDGTIRGEAFDDAAMSSVAWRMQAGLSTDLYNAQQQFQDDPAGFQAASEQIRETYLKEIEDPQMQETFDKAFQQRTEAYRQNIAARHETQLRQQQEADYAAGLSARQIDIERQAQVLGANPKGDEILSEQVRATQLSIDGAVRSGTLTPAQGEKAKIEIATTAARGRIQGVYDALSTPDQKEQYSLGLLDDWKEGKGPLAALPFATVKSLSDTLRRDALEQKNIARAQNKVEAAKLGSLIDDDIASVSATGKGLDPTTTDLTPERVQSLLGDDGLQKWQEKREFAGRVFDATNGMNTQSATDIAERLAMIEPKPGTPGYAEDLEIYTAAQKQAAAVIKERSADPALSVQKAFPEVQAAADAADPQDPASMQSLVAARINAQKAIGISDFEQSPLTADEARSLARPVSAQADPRLASQTMMDTVTQIQQTYGPYADQVVSQMLASQGVSKEMAGLGAGYFRRLMKNQGPTTADKRQGQVISETDAADAAGAPIASDAFPLPNYKQRQALISQPEKAAEFDQKFGPGASLQILGRSAPAWEDPDKNYRTPAGLVETGNIDLNNRPVVKNDDGSISTVRSMSINEDGVEVLIPTISPSGTVLTDEGAVELYRSTGKHLGKFKSAKEADAYAQTLHSAQARQYRGGS